MRWKARKDPFPARALPALLALSLLLANAPSAFADWNEGVDAFRAGHYAEAAEIFRAVVEQHPDYASGYYMLGSALIKLDRPADALPALRRAEELSPEPRHALALTQAQLAVGRSAEALATLARHPPADLTPELRQPYAQMLAAAALKSEPAAALPALELAVARLENSKELWIALGGVRERAGNLAGAFDALERAARLAPEDWEVVRRAVGAGSRAALERRDEAARRALYARAAALADAAAARHETAEACLLAGEARLGAGDYGDARGWFERALPLLEEGSDKALAHYYLARCDVGLGQEVAVLAHLDAALGEGPEAELARRIHSARGHALHRQKEYARAARAFRQAGDEIRAAEMDAAVEAQEINRDVEAKRRECLERKARYDAMREENENLIGTTAWAEIELEIERKMADCRPFLEE